MLKNDGIILGEVNGEIAETAIFQQPKNSLFLGKAGAGYKSKTFNENEFKSELAPLNSTIENWTLNDKKMVTIRYRVN